MTARSTFRSSRYPAIRDRLILLNGFSKTWAMTGWRLGWSIWPEKLYDKVRKLAVNCWSCVNAPAQFAGIAAIDGPQDAVHEMVAAFDRAAAQVVTELLNTLPGVSCVTPKGAFYAFPNVSKTGWQAKPLANALLDEAGVALIGGPDFGVNGEGYIRVSYANSEENIRRATERMGDFLTRNATARTPSRRLTLRVGRLRESLRRVYQAAGPRGCIKVLATFRNGIEP